MFAICCWGFCSDNNVSGELMCFNKRRCWRWFLNPFTFPSKVLLCKWLELVVIWFWDRCEKWRISSFEQQCSIIFLNARNLFRIFLANMERNLLPATQYTKKFTDELTIKSRWDTEIVHNIHAGGYLPIFFFSHSIILSTTDES